VATYFNFIDTKLPLTESQSEAEKDERRATRA